jgi:hypothetical protein
LGGLACVLVYSLNHDESFLVSSVLNFFEFTLQRLLGQQRRVI